MYPYDILPGIDMYTVMLALAVLASLILFRIFADRMRLSAKLQNLCIFTAAGSIISGYFFAVLFQAFYNIEKYGEFRLNSNTGATFYGGLIGGAAMFLLIYFTAGHFLFKNSNEHLTHFFDISEIAAVSISAAHSIGRVGCLMMGCCHGAVTDKWFGIYMVALAERVVPIQLFETIFLACIAALFAVRIIRGKYGNLALYMIIYGAWRFVIEYARDDYRGTTLVSFLTPSQLVAVCMIVGGAILLFTRRKLLDKITGEKNEKKLEE